MYSLIPAERNSGREGGAPVLESVEKTEASRQGAELRRGICPRDRFYALYTNPLYTCRELVAREAGGYWRNNNRL